MQAQPTPRRALRASAIVLTMLVASAVCWASSARATRLTPQPSSKADSVAMPAAVGQEDATWSRPSPPAESDGKIPVTQRRGGVITIGSFDGSRSARPLTTSGTWSLLRADLADPANFGPGGVVSCPATLAPATPTLTAAYLAGVDIFLTNELSSPLSAPEQIALNDFVLAGGVLILDADTGGSVANVNSALTALGVGSTYNGASGCGNSPTGGTITAIPNVVTNGPFGNVPGASFGTSLGRLLTLDMQAASLVNCASDILRAVYLPGAIAPGSGLVMFGGDVSGMDFFYPGNVLPNANNQVIYLNAIASVCGAAPCEITCPANVTQANDTNQCGAVVTYAAPTTTGSCGPIVCSPASGSFFPVGTTTVTCMEDILQRPEGNPIPSCSFTVTVNDTQAPTITCPANVTQGNDANQCGAVVNYAAPTASDNCPGVTTMCTPAAGSFFPVGTTSVTCTATDATGNTATCGFTVTVNDTQAPSITCPANITTSGTATATCALSGVVNYPAPTVSDNCPGVGVPVCVPASGSTFPEGTTTVTCTVSDAIGNTATCSFTVTVTSVGAFGACAVDDFSGDTWSIVTDPNSPIFRFWRYRVALTGEVFCGTASAMAFIPNRSLTASDTDDPRFYMNANLNYGARAGTVKVVDQATGRQFVIKDRNLNNNPPCQ